MRRRSMTGPLMLLIIGSLFLWRNLHPETHVFNMLAMYWPFILIVWGTLRLLEVLAWRRQGVGGFSGGETVLIIMICIAGSGLWQAQQHGFRFNAGGLQMFGEQYDYPVSASGSAVGMKRVVFDNPRGNIKVIGADTNEVTVTGHKVIRAWGRTDADRTHGNTPLEVVQQGDRILIRSNQDHVPDNQQLSDDLEVTVPRGMAVEARGRVGDYEVSDVTGDLELAADRSDVRIMRIGGNVRLDIGRSEVIRAADVAGKLELQGRGSDIEMENVKGQVIVNGSYNGTLEFKNLAKPLQFEGTRNTELRVAAIPGRISMDLSQFSATNVVGPIRLVTGSRDVRMEQFTQSLELETQRGDIELTPGHGQMPSIEARSGGGRIDLILPEKASFDLQATAERGEAVNDYGAVISKEVEGRASTLKGKVGSGPSIHLTATRGAVTVRKEGMPPSDIDGVPAQNEPRPPKPPRPPKNVKDTEIRM